MLSQFPKIPNIVEKNYFSGENFDVMKRNSMENVFGVDKVINLTFPQLYLIIITLRLCRKSLSTNPIAIFHRDVKYEQNFFSKITRKILIFHCQKTT